MPKAVADNQELSGYDPKQVGQIICTRYPFLRNPAGAATFPAGLNKLTHIAILTHRLMAIEAQALTGAVEYLRGVRGVLALPMHDGLIVPVSGARHVAGGLDGTYSCAANRVRIKCKIVRPQEKAGG